MSWRCSDPIPDIARLGPCCGAGESHRSRACEGDGAGKAGTALHWRDSGSWPIQPGRLDFNPSLEKPRRRCAVGPGQPPAMARRASGRWPCARRHTESPRRPDKSGGRRCGRWGPSPRPVGSNDAAHVPASRSSAGRRISLFAGRRGGGPMTESQGYVDLHLHLLPNVDDGPRSMEDAVDMARVLVDDGVAAATVTPHFNEWNPDLLPNVDALTEQIDSLRQSLDSEQVPLQLLTGAEHSLRLSYYTSSSLARRRPWREGPTSLSSCPLETNRSMPTSCSTSWVCRRLCRSWLIPNGIGGSNRILTVSGHSASAGCSCS